MHAIKLKARRALKVFKIWKQPKSCQNILNSCEARPFQNKKIMTKKYFEVAHAEYQGLPSWTKIMYKVLMHQYENKKKNFFME